MTSDRDPEQQEPLANLSTVLARVLRSVVPDRADREDIVQEAIARTLEVRPRLADDVVGPYAMTVARNLARGLRSREALRLRHQPRLYEPPVDIGPAESLALLEQDQAVRAAVAALPENERVVLLGHVVAGREVAELAGAVGSTPGGVAARLARARARARVDYLLTLRRQNLPTEECRPVLLAISAADRRRQDALRASEHLLGCQVCPTLVRPLAERSSALAGLLPIPVLVAAARLRANRPAQATAAVGAAVLAGGIATAVATARDHPVKPPVSVAAASGSTGVAATSSRGPQDSQPAGAGAPTAGPTPSPRSDLGQSTPTTDPVPPTQLHATKQPQAASPVQEAGKGRTVSGVVTDVGAPYGFRMQVDGADYYVVFTGLPRHPVRVGNHLRVTATVTPFTATVVNDPEDVEAAERTSVARLRRYLATTAARIVFAPGS